MPESYFVIYLPLWKISIFHLTFFASCFPFFMSRFPSLHIFHPSTVKSGCINFLQFNQTHQLVSTCEFLKTFFLVTFSPPRYILRSQNHFVIVYMCSNIDFYHMKKGERKEIKNTDFVYEGKSSYENYNTVFD